MKKGKKKRKNTIRLQRAGITFPPGPLRETEDKYSYGGLWNWFQQRAVVVGMRYRGHWFTGAEFGRTFDWLAACSERFRSYGILQRPWRRSEIIAICEECLRRRIIGWGPHEED